MIIVFSYQREEMLKQVLNDLKGENVTILDDGSDFKIDHPNVIRFKNGGKEKFWEKWFVAFKIAEGSDDDLFVFMPSDFLDIDLKRIRQKHEQMKDKPYVYNIINDGRDWCWLPFKAKQIDEDTIQVGFTDCGFFCNRSALERIDFKMREIDNRRFKTRTDISSGVGQYLTTEFTRRKVPMYKPVKSLAYHGDHPSVMHPDLRIKNPLISK